jgi:hypothetical protein
MRPSLLLRLLLPLLLVLASPAQSGGRRRLWQGEEEQEPTGAPDAGAATATSTADALLLPDTGAPDCAADGSDLTRSRALALERTSTDDGPGFVVVTATVVAVGSGARCSGEGGAVELAFPDDDAGSNNNIHLLLYAQCVHSGALACRSNEDRRGSGEEEQGLAAACVLTARVPPPDDEGDEGDGPPAGLSSSCTLAQGGKYTFLLQEEEREEDAGLRCPGRYRLAGKGVWDSVRPPTGLSSCVPWPRWPAPPGADERDDRGALGGLLTASSGRCPGGGGGGGGGVEEQEEEQAWRGACPLPDDSDGGGGSSSTDRRRGACPPSSAVACFPRAACPGRLMLGQVLLPGLLRLPTPPRSEEAEEEDREEGGPASSASASSAAAAAYVDRVTGAAVRGCGVGLERARAQGQRIKRVAAGAEEAGAQRGPLMPRRLGLAMLAAAAGARGR